MFFVREVKETNNEYTCEKLEKIVENKTMENISAGNLSVTVVYDNNPYRNELEAAWGFSCHNRRSRKKIFYLIPEEVVRYLMKICKKLKINPNKIDIVMLSHIHGAHTEGVGSFLKQNRNVLVYNPDSFPENFELYVED